MLQFNLVSLPRQQIFSTAVSISSAARICIQKLRFKQRGGGGGARWDMALATGGGPRRHRQLMYEHIQFVLLVSP